MSGVGDGKVKVGNVELNYELRGEGCPLAFIHCLGGRLQFWERISEKLARSFKTLAYDIRGFGSSQALKEEGWDIPQCAGDVVGLLEALGVDRAVFLGHSMGGMIAMRAALDRPDKVIALILADTTAGFSPEGAASLESRAAVVEREGMGAIVEAVLQGWFTEAFLGRPEVDFFRRSLLGTDPYWYGAACRAISRYSLKAEAERITQPTLVVVGSRDKVTPLEAALDLNQRIPNSYLRVVPEAAHLPFVERPEIFDRAVEGFLGWVCTGKSFTG